MSSPPSFFVLAATILCIARGAFLVMLLSLLFAYLLEPAVTWLQRHSRLAQKNHEEKRNKRCSSYDRSCGRRYRDNGKRAMGAMIYHPLRGNTVHLVVVTD
jgi:hypothetical protein